MKFRFPSQEHNIFSEHCSFLHPGSFAVASIFSGKIDHPLSNAENINPAFPRKSKRVFSEQATSLASQVSQMSCSSESSLKKEVSVQVLPPPKLKRCNLRKHLLIPYLAFVLAAGRNRTLVLGVCFLFFSL